MRDIRGKILDIDKNICEEKTKMYLVLPVIKSLGYDIHSPFDIIPEYKPIYYTGNDRVDYALCDDGSPRIYVEVKRLRTELDEKNITWLAKYFNSDPYVKVGILTNGEKYLFFTDSKYENMMDTEPFLEIDMKRFSSIDRYLIEYFHKDIYNANSVELCMENINSIKTLVNAFKLLYTNKENFMLLKEKGNDEVMKEIYRLAGIDEDKLTFNMAYEILPLHKI